VGWRACSGHSHAPLSIIYHAVLPPWLSCWLSGWGCRDFPLRSLRHRPIPLPLRGIRRSGQRNRSCPW
jgi:hypothetical protein